MPYPQAPPTSIRLKPAEKDAVRRAAKAKGYTMHGFMKAAVMAAAAKVTGK